MGLLISQKQTTPRVYEVLFVFYNNSFVFALHVLTLSSAYLAEYVYQRERGKIMHIKKQVTHSSGYIGILVVFSIFFSIAAVLASYSFGNLINGISEFLPRNMADEALFVTLLFICQYILEYGYFAIRGRFLAHGNRCLQSKCALSLMGAEMPWLRAQGSGDIMGRLQMELQMSASLLCETLPDLILQGIRIALFTSVIAFINWKLAVLYLCVIVVIGLVQTLLSKPIQARTRIVQEKRADSNSIAREIISQRITIKSYSAHSLVMRWYENRLNSWLKTTVGTELISSPLRTLGWVCGIAPMFMLCIIGAVFVQNKSLSFGAFMVVYFLAEQMTNDCMHYIDLFIQYRRGSAAAQRLCDIIDAPQENASNNCDAAEDIDAPVVTFEDVSFSYNDDEDSEKKDTLSDISFEIKRGEKVAFVGGSGSGKSTLLGLAQGFLTAQKGNVRICGKLSADARSNMSFVPQLPFMFAETLENNIMLGTEMNSSGLHDVYERSGVDAFLGELPNGDKTVIGGDGVNLSTGQQQRIAIARGLVKNAQIILMDEVTSALDAKSDKKVFDAIKKLPPSTSVLVVTHRLENLRDFDMIYVMDKGRIVERGKYDALINAGGVYSRLWNVQKETV